MYKKKTILRNKSPVHMPEKLPSIMPITEKKKQNELILKERYYAMHDKPSNFVLL